MDMKLTYESLKSLQFDHVEDHEEYREFEALVAGKRILLTLVMREKPYAYVMLSTDEFTHDNILTIEQANTLIQAKDSI